MFVRISVLVACLLATSLTAWGQQDTGVPSDAPTVGEDSSGGIDTSYANGSSLQDTITINHILLEGHKRTRTRVIHREMGMREGERIARTDLQERVERSYNTLMNTGLFASVDVTMDTISPARIDLAYQIRETWYIYPVPVFELADRNFNVWWDEQNASLDRVNYGGKLSFYNFTGQRDRLRVGVTTGYTQEYDFSYSHPYINPSGTIGMELNYQYQHRHEQNYLTLNNRQEFYANDDDFVYRNIQATLSVQYRRKLYVAHTIEFGFNHTTIADTIANVLNPDFLGNGRSRQRFARLAYRYDDDRRDVRNYPWDGYRTQATVEKDGLGIIDERDGLTLGFSHSRFIPVGRKFSLNFGVAGKYSLIRTQQPFLENRAIGFGSNGLDGYQFHVVDGLDMAIWRMGIRREIWKADFNLPKIVFLEAFRYVPFRMLLAINLNQGFANSPFVGEGNPLNNRLLSGASAGVDFVLYYDMVASVEYTRNHLGEDGVFLALQFSF